MKVDYNKDNTKIYDCYLIKNFDRDIYNIMRDREEKGFPITRSLRSYINETKAHAKLYNLGLFKSHTKDADLEENITPLKELIYSIIGR